MTTIACGDGYMAADSQATGDAKCHVRKIERVRDTLVGFAGTAGGARWAIQWLRKGADPKDPPCMDDVQLLVYSSRGIWIYDEDFTPYQVLDHYAAIGSGEQAALAALHLGKEPREAVEVAKRIDAYTGGRVYVRWLESAIRAHHRRSNEDAQSG